MADTAEMKSKPQGEPTVQSKNDKPQGGGSLWEQLLVVLIAGGFLSTSMYIFYNPTSIAWLEPYVMNGFMTSATPDSPYIVKLSTENLDDVRSSDGYLVEFYAPWCGHCRNFAPEYAKAATSLHEVAKLGALDATAHKDFAVEYGVQGFPTVVWFSNGQTKKYEGDRTAVALTRWVLKQKGVATTLLTSNAEVSEFIATSKPSAVLGIFDEGSSERTSFDEVALADDGRGYGIFSTMELAKPYCDKSPCTVLLSDYRDSQASYSWDKVTSEALRSFIEVETFPIVMEFNQKNANAILQSKFFKTIAFLFSPDSDLAKNFQTLAFDNHDEILHVLVKSEAKLKKYLGISEVDDPAFVLVNKNEAGRLLKYPLMQTLSTGSATATIKEFITRYQNGEMQPVFKSSDLPGEQTGPVVNVVGLTLDQYVGGNKCVFIEVYAPWCGHCKKLEPVWKRLGEKYSDLDEVVIAKMDGTENEVVQFEVKGFPSLFLFESGNGTATPYSGKRMFGELDSFLTKHCKIDSPQDGVEDRDEL